MQKCATKVEPSTSSTKGKNHWRHPNFARVGCECCMKLLGLEIFIVSKIWLVPPVASISQWECNLQEKMKHFPAKTTSRWKSNDLWIGIYQNHTSPEQFQHGSCSTMISTQKCAFKHGFKAHITQTKPGLPMPKQHQEASSSESASRPAEGRDVNGNMKWKRNPLEIRRRLDRYMISSFWVSRPISLTIIYKTKLKKWMTFYKNHGPSTSKPSTSHRLQVFLENPTLAWQGQQNKQPVLGGPGRSTYQLGGWWCCFLHG